MISTQARVVIRLAAVKYPVRHPHRHTRGRNRAYSRRAGRLLISPIQSCAIKGDARYRQSATTPLKIRAYTPQTRRIRLTFSGLRRPSSSAVRYMVEVRMPPMPAVIASMPTDSTNCNRPTPAGPIRPETYT